MGGQGTFGGIRHGWARFDTQARGLPNDLCFLDEREQDLDPVNEVISGHGELGVIGPFAALFGKDGRYVAEVASAFAGARPFPRAPDIVHTGRLPGRFMTGECLQSHRPVHHQPSH